jgi:Na+/proline symporter
VLWQLFYVQGVILSPAVIPIGLTVGWKKLTTTAVIIGPISGAVLGMLAWMIGCWKIYGSITITNLAEPYSAVCSGLVGLLFSGIITVAVTLIGKPLESLNPKPFVLWKTLKQIPLTTTSTAPAISQFRSMTRSLW